MSDINPLDLSDEDFMKLSSPESLDSGVVVQEPVVEQVAEVAQEPVVQEQVENEVDTGNVVVEETPGDRKPDGEIDTENPDGTAQVEEQPKPGESETKGPEATVPPSGSENEGAAKENETKPVDYQAEYSTLMAPIKANGKTLEFRNPEELRQLAQMGANYTQKMQAIAPHRKMLTMAQNNGIDEDKLSFLIDLDKGNPEAIQKLLKDKGIDPLGIDVESDNAYREGTHKVDDKEVQFQSVVEDMASTQHGLEILQTVQSSWDKASRDAIWDDPNILSALHKQKENGIFDRISTEMDRMKTLGTIPVGTGFLESYRIAGDKIMESGGFDDLIQKANPPKPEPVVVQPIAERVAAPVIEVDNSDKARAAAPSKAASNAAKTTVNPLDMSDEDYMKQFGSFIGRV